MVFVMDEQRQFTVALDVPIVEGQAVIDAIEFAQSAEVGATFAVCWGQVTNTGGSDTVILRLVDADTTQIVAESSVAVDAGGVHQFAFDGVMPDRTWNLALQAGHEE